MPQYLVSLKATAEVAASTLVDANSEAEAKEKAQKKAEQDALAWTSPKVEQATVKTTRVFRSI